MIATPPKHKNSSLLRQLNTDFIGGLVLIFITLLALVIANSVFSPLYFSVLNYHAGPLSVLHWINDGLMAIFFLQVGLEIKKELLDGELSTWPRRILPGVAAAGGMFLPSLIYVAFNLNTPNTLRGWAIPSATDIAFALGVLALLGSRVPTSLKIFLTALAIIDDLGAVAIIAIFYAESLSVLWLAFAGGAVATIVVMNKSGVKKLSPYLVLGVVLWIFVLKSGVHSTLAGVALALTIPMPSSNNQPNSNASPLLRLEHGIQPWVRFLVIPIFGLANAGVILSSSFWATLLEPITLGVAAGLFIGKQFGVFLTTYAVAALGFADRPTNANWAQIYGVSLLAGIGFTMSLFIGNLAFPGSPEHQDAVKIGVLVGSLCSALLGVAALLLAKNKRSAEN